MANDTWFVVEVEAQGIVPGDVIWDGGWFKVQRIEGGGKYGQCFFTEGGTTAEFSDDDLVLVRRP